MKNNKINFIISIKNKSGKLMAFPLQSYSNYNLQCEFSKIKGLLTINYMPSYKQAKELSRKWNEAYKNNNNLMSYDEYHELQIS